MSFFNLFFWIQGTIGGSPSTVIKRRAPPCLNDFCRLGCMCTSLIQERRQNHCGKPQCMLGCDCLRRKVVLLKNEDTNEESAPVNDEEEDVSKVKKKKRRISYSEYAFIRPEVNENELFGNPNFCCVLVLLVLSGPEAAPEPVLHVKTLWVKQNDADSEPLYIPDPARPLHPPPVSLDLQKDLENFLHPSPKRGAVRAVSILNLCNRFVLVSLHIETAWQN